jgi:hypothetical protein
MSDRQQSCEARVDDELKKTIESFEEFRSRIAKAEEKGDWPAVEDVHQEVYEYPLSVDVERVVTIQLSTGGPGDQLEYTIDSDGDVSEIRYRFLDWFDGAARTISHDTPAHEAALWFFEMIVPDVESLQ